MTRNPYQHPIEEPAMDGPPKVSALAVSSLVFGLLCCIPLSGLLGTILGGAGLVRIAKSDGRLTGRGMAFTGLILGLLGTMFWIGAGSVIIYGFKEAQKYAQPILQISQGDYAGARQRLSPSTAAALTDERAKAFADEVKDAAGAPQRMPKGIFEWISNYAEVGQFAQNVSAGAPANTRPVPLPVHFDKGLAVVGVYLDNNASVPGGGPAVKNISIHTRDGKTIWMVPPDTGPGTPQRPRATRSFPVRTSSRSLTAARSSTGSTSMFSRARRWSSWVARARARARCFASSSDRSAPRRGRSGSSGRTSPRWMNRA